MATGTTIDDSSVSGITASWTGTLTYGQYDTCDSLFWVVEPTPGAGVSFTAYTPAQSGTGSSFTNGAILGSVMAANPKGNSGFYQSFDGRSSGGNAAPDFNEDLMPTLPVTVQAGDCLIISKGWDPIYGDGTARPYFIESYMIVYVVAAEPEADALAPPYLPVAGLTLPDFDDIDLATKLPDFGITRPASTPDIDDIELWVGKPFMDYIASYRSEWMLAQYEQVQYGRYLARRIGEAMCLATLVASDDTDIDLAAGSTATTRRNQLVKNLLQMGIFIYGTMKNGKRFIENGGQAMGRKGPMLWAGHVLGISDMTTGWVRNGEGLFYFQEDGQTFAVTASDVDRVIETLRSGTATGGSTTNILLDPATELAQRPFRQVSGRTLRFDAGTGSGQSTTFTENKSSTADLDVAIAAVATAPDATTEYTIRSFVEADVGTYDWGVRHSTYPTKDNPSPLSEYRDLAMNALFGQVLSCCALDLEGAWGWPPLINYLERVKNDGGSVYHFTDAGANGINDFQYDLCVAAWDSLVDSPTAGALEVRLWPEVA